MTKETNPELVEHQELIKMPDKFAAIQPNPNFYEILKEIESTVSKGETLLKEAESTEDEDKLVEIQTALKPVSQLVTRIEDARKSVRRMYDTEKKRVDTIFGELLDKSGYQEVVRIQNEAKRLKTTLQENRKNKQWDELFEYYEDVLEHTYPTVKKHLPNLTPDWFKKQNPSFVSGAKNAKVTKRHKSDIDAMLEQRQTELNVILNLESPFQSELIDRYSRQLDLPDAIEHNKRLQEQAKRAEEKRLENLKRQKEQVEKANQKNEKKAKLTNTTAKKESTVYIDKMYRIGQVYQEAIHAEKVDEALAKALYNKIKVIVNEDEA